MFGSGCATNLWVDSDTCPLGRQWIAPGVRPGLDCGLETEPQWRGTLPVEFLQGSAAPSALSHWSCSCPGFTTGAYALLRTVGLAAEVSA